MKPIGIGSYGAVYVMKYHKMKVAFKNLTKLLPQTILEILEEAKLMNKLTHPNIITFYGVVRDPKNFGIVMEYHSFGNLYDFLHKVK